MLVLWLVQIVLGVFTLTSAFVAGQSALRNLPRAGLFVTLTGTAGLLFFLTLKAVPFEMIAVALLAIVVGAVLAPRGETSSPLIDDDVEIGESTATRRLKR